MRFQPPKGGFLLTKMAECLKTTNGECKLCPWLIAGQRFVERGAESRSTTDYIADRFCPPGNSPAEKEVKNKPIVGLDSLIISS